MKRLRGLGLGLFASVCLAPSAFADKIILSAGAEYSTGDYGEPVSTDAFYEFLAAKYVFGPWSVRLSVPFLQSDGPGAIVGDDGEFGADGVDRMIAGLGDVSITGVKTFEWKDESLFLDIIGRVRIPTGDHSAGLGSGAVDTSLALELAKEFGALSIFAQGGRRFLSDRDGEHRQDGWVGSAGVSYDIGDRVEIGGSVDWREAAFDEDPDPVEVYGYVSFPVSERVKVTTYGTVGLAGDSPDYSIGLTASWRVYSD